MMISSLTPPTGGNSDNGAGGRNDRDDIDVSAIASAPIPDDPPDPSAAGLSNIRARAIGEQAIRDAASSTNDRVESEILSEGLNLTPRQAAFVHEYLIDLRAKAAYIRAGYSPNAAHICASQLLANPKIRAAVERGKAQRLSRINVTQERVLSEMALLANSSIEHYQIDDEGNVTLAPGAPDGAMAAVQSIKRRTRVHYNPKGEVVRKDYDVELRLWDKPQPLKLMGRHVGLFPDRVEVTGKDGGPIEIAAAKLAEMPTDQLAAKAAEIAGRLAIEGESSGGSGGGGGSAGDRK